MPDPTSPQPHPSTDAQMVPSTSEAANQPGVEAPLGSEGGEPPAKRKPRYRWLKRAGIALLVCVVGYFILTSQMVMSRIVLAILSNASGGQVTASKVNFGATGTISLEKPKLRAPGVEGTGGEVFSAAKVTTRLNWPGLFSSSIPLVESLELDRPIFRISQSVDDGTVNIAHLVRKKVADPSGQSHQPGAKTTKAPRSPIIPPLVRVISGVVEVGEHNTDAAKHGGHYSFLILKRFEIEGDVENRPIVPGVTVTNSDGDISTIRLRQVSSPGQRPDADGIQMEGIISKDAITLSAPSLKLTSLPLEAIPTRLREEFESLALEGEISGTTLTYNFSGGLEVRIGLEDVAISLPIPVQPGIDTDDNAIPVPEALASRLLRMSGVAGEVFLTDKGARGAIQGEVEGLPYAVTFTVDGTDDTAPFEARLICEGYELTADPQVALFAPGLVRRRLEQFSDPTGIVDIDMTLSRGAPVDGKAADIKVSGKMNLTNGSAAFERFPYRFYNLSVEATFDENSLKLKNIIGDTPDGATVRASADISPLTDDAGVLVDVEVKGLPVNQTLAKAMKGRGKIVDALFNRERFEALEKAGLVISPTNAQSAAKALAELVALTEPLSPSQLAEKAALEAKVALPLFEPGGVANVTVQVTRVEGVEAIWNDTVKVHFPKVSVLPEAFPYPLLAEDVTINKIDYDTKVSGGIYHGLHGGTATLTASVDLEQLEAPNVPFVPDVHVEAQQIPVNELLLFALPDASRISPDGRPLRDLIRDVGLSGQADATVKVWLLDPLPPGQMDDVTGFDIKVKPSAMTALPARSERWSTRTLVDNGSSGNASPGNASPAPAKRIAMNQIKGDVHITQDLLALNLSGNIGPHQQDAPLNQLSLAPFTIQVNAGMSPSPIQPPTQPPTQPSTAPAPSTPAGPALLIDVRTQALDIATPIEDAIAIFAPSAAVEIETLRAEHTPTGVLDLRARVERSTSGEPLHVLTQALNLKSVELAIGPFATTTTIAIPGQLPSQANTDRVRVSSNTSQQGQDPNAGVISVHITDSEGANQSYSPQTQPTRTARTLEDGENIIVSFDQVHLDLSAQDFSGSKLFIDGQFTSNGNPTSLTEPLNVNVQGAVLESTVGVLALQRFTPRSIADYLITHDAAGVMNAFITATPYQTSQLDHPFDWNVSGSLEPKVLALTLSSQRVQTTCPSGTIDFSPGGGFLRNIEVRAATWSGLINGAWTSATDGSTGIDATLALDAQSLTPDLIAILPEDLRIGLADVTASASGPVSTKNVTLALFYDSTGELAKFKSSGHVIANGVELDAGIEIKQAHAAITYTAERSAPHQPTTFDVTTEISSLKAADVTLTNALLRIVSEDDPARIGIIDIPTINADCHGGRITGTAVIFPAASPSPQTPNHPNGNAQPRRKFQAQLQGSNIRFASVLTDRAKVTAAQTPQGQLAQDQLEQVSPENAPVITPPIDDVTPDGTRGLLDFGLTMSGAGSHPESRRGKGNANITGGKVVSLPLLIPLIRVSNLQLPMDEKLDFAQVDFFISGNNFQIEEAIVSSPTVELVGYGSATWPDMNLDMRLRAYSLARIPLITGILERIRNEVFTARVTGTAADPDIGFESFSGTSRFLKKIIGATPSDADVKLRRIEESAKRGPRKSRPEQSTVVVPEEAP